MYLRIKGVQSGPFDVDGIAREYREGHFDGSVMSWCEGEDGWTSLGKRWTPRRRTLRPAIGFVVALVAVAGAVAIAKSQLKMLPFRFQTGAVLWGCAIALGIIAAVGVYEGWRARHRRDRAGLIVALSTIIVMIVGLRAVAITSLDYPVLQLRQREPNASVSFDRLQNAIRIHGQLGARLGEQVRTVLERHPGASLLVLDSPGGLVEDALEVARLVHARNMTARVEGTCASACVAIWAAAARHQMTATSRIGVHQLRIGSHLPAGFVRKAKLVLQRQYDGFLRAAGFDGQVVDTGNQTPATGMYWLDPLQVADAGVDVTILDAHGASVSTAMAQWLWVESRFGAKHTMGKFMLAVREHEPVLVARHAYAVYGAVAAKDADATRRAVHALSTDAERYAFWRASDAATVAWAKSTYAALDGSARKGSRCALATNSDPSASAVEKADFAVATVTDLDRLIDNVGPLDSVHPLPSLDDPQVRQMARHAWASAKHRGFPTQGSRWTPRQWCDFRVDFIGYALRLPRHQAAQVVRFLELKK